MLLRVAGVVLLGVAVVYLPPIITLSIAAVILAYGFHPATKLRGYPGPAFVPFVGSLFDILKKGTHVFYQEIAQKYGTFARFYDGVLPFLLVTDLDAVRSICFENFQTFHDRLPFFQVRKSSGLLLAKGQLWKRTRNALVPTFDEKHLKSFAEPINEAAVGLVNRIKGHLELTPHEPINIWRFFGGYTLQVVGATNFGLSIQSQAENSSGVELQNAAAFIFSQTLGGNPTTYILFRMFPWLQTFAFMLSTTLFPKIFDAIDKLDAVGERVIKERMENPAEQGSYVADFVSLLLKATIKEEGDRKLRPDEIRDQCNTFLLAGYETTANTLAYTIYNLSIPANRPSLIKLLKEIDANNKPGNPIPTYADLASYPYLGMVVDESLRLYPPGAVLSRVANSTIEVCGHVIPEGTAVFMPVYAIHRDPKHWPEPEVFRPERFLPEEKAKRHPMAYLPFGAGQRMCIGMRFALEETKLGLITLLQNFTFQLNAPTTVPLKLSARLTLSPEDGVFVTPVPRTVFGAALDA